MALLCDESYPHCVGGYPMVSCAVGGDGTHTVQQPIRGHWHTVTAGVPSETTEEQHTHTHTHTHSTVCRKSRDLQVTPHTHLQTVTAGQRNTSHSPHPLSVTALPPQPSAAEPSPAGGREQDGMVRVEEEQCLHTEQCCEYSKAPCRSRSKEGKFQ